MVDGRDVGRTILEDSRDLLSFVGIPSPHKLVYGSLDKISSVIWNRSRSWDFGCPVPCIDRMSWPSDVAIR